MYHNNVCKDPLVAHTVHNDLICTSVLGRRILWIHPHVSDSSLKCKVTPLWIKLASFPSKFYAQHPILIYVISLFILDFCKFIANEKQRNHVAIALLIHSLCSILLQQLIFQFESYSQYFLNMIPEDRCAVILDLTLKVQCKHIVGALQMETYCMHTFSSSACVFTFHAINVIIFISYLHGVYTKGTVIRALQSV